MRRRHRIPWQRGESLAALYLERLLAKGELTKAHKATLADAMGRTHAAIQKHIGNYVALDPSVHHSGLAGISRLTEGIWTEYQRDPRGVFAQARQAYLSITEGCENPEEGGP